MPREERKLKNSVFISERSNSRNESSPRSKGSEGALGKIHSISGPRGVAKATNPLAAAKTSNLRDGKPYLNRKWPRIVAQREMPNFFHTRESPPYSLCSALDLAVVRTRSSHREIPFLIEPGERRSASEELAIEKGKLQTQVQVPS